MAKLSFPKEGGSYTPPPAGNHVARCIQFVDLGTQESTWEGTTSHKRRIRISWELPSETRTYESQDGTEKTVPHVIGAEYTLSMHAKSGLRIMLESWRGKKFTKEEIESFDETAILGKSCMINVSHNEVGEKTYANVSAVTPMPKGMECPEQFNEDIFFFMGLEFKKTDFNEKKFAKLIEWLQDKIKKSPEYQKTHASRQDRLDDNSTEEEKQEATIEAAKEAIGGEEKKSGEEGDDKPF